ncbi:MAG: TauD/TfdA family dioxygenase [Acidimicrobiia bacterium]
MTATARVQAPLHGPAAWIGEDLVGSDEWIHVLTPAEIAELDAAVSEVGRRGWSRDQIGRAEFPLPTLGATIDSWADELDGGRGFVLVRGLPVDRYTEEEASIAYWGIGRHLGVPVSQNTDGDLLGHVRDTGADPDDPSVRLYKTRAAQPYHTDGSDVVGLLCLHTASSGGASSIVSSVTVFNEVSRRRPDLVDLFFEPFYFDLYEQQAPGEKPYLAMPIASFFSGRLYTMYIRFYIERAQRHPEVPRLSGRQVELLDLIDEIAHSAHFHLDMEFRPGDMQWLSNAVILHGRTAYEDDASAPRHLLRLWLTLHRHAPVPTEGFGGIPTKEAAP